MTGPFKTWILILMLGLASGCEERCFVDGPGVRVEITLAGGLSVSQVKTIVVSVTLKGVTYQQEVPIAGQLDDGETAVEVDLSKVVGDAYEAEVEVLALDAQRAIIASAVQNVLGAAGECKIINLTLYPEIVDQGFPILDGGTDGIKKDAKKPKPDTKKPKQDLKKPKPDVKQPKPDLKQPKPDLPPPPPDMPPPPPDMPPPPPDMPPPPPDMPPPPPDAPPPPPDMPPAPKDVWPEGTATDLLSHTH